jgi:hypothetical protein
MESLSPGQEEDQTGLDSTWVLSPNHQISFVLQAPVELRKATTIVKRD